MNVLEYFDCEKQLLRDYEAVKTSHAKTAIFNTLLDTLDRHKEFGFTEAEDVKRGKKPETDKVQEMLEHAKV